MTNEDLFRLATKFDFGVIYIKGEYPFKLSIEHRGDNRWAIAGDVTTVLSKTGQWIFEPSPSNRSETFIENTRYTREEAVAKVEELIATSLSEEAWKKTLEVR